MKIIIKFLSLSSFLLILLLGGAQKMFGQSRNDSIKQGVTSDPVQSFISARQQTQFPKVEHWQTTDSIKLSLPKLGQKTFIRFGFIGCHPCEVSNPAFIKLALANKDVTFVYVSFDKPNDIKNEFAAYLNKGKLPENLYLVSVSRKEIDSLKLTFGYPTNYLLDSSGVIQTVILGNSIEDNQENSLTELWQKKINQL